MRDRIFVSQLDALIIKKIAAEYSPATLDRLELRVCRSEGGPGV